MTITSTLSNSLWESDGIPLTAFCSKAEDSVEQGIADLALHSSKTKYFFANIR